MPRFVLAFGMLLLAPAAFAQSQALAVAPASALAPSPPALDESSALIAITQNSSIDVTDGTVRCASSTDDGGTPQGSTVNSFYRVFDLTQYSVPDNAVLNSIDYGVRITIFDEGTRPATGDLIVSTLPAGTDVSNGFATSALTPLASEEVTFAADSLALVTTPFSAPLMLTGSELLVVELAFDAGTFDPNENTPRQYDATPGANEAPADGVTYLSTPDCGGIPPTPFQQIGSGFDGEWVVVLSVGPPTTSSVVIDGARGVRYLGPPAEGITVDDLAAQNLVRGVPGYYSGNPNPTLWTSYDPVAGVWVPSAGTGEVLALAKVFRWYLLDRDGVGDPAVSVSRALPFTLATGLPANDRQVRLALDTSGNRFNHLANPFAEPLDVSGIRSWQGGLGLSPNSEVYTYDPATGAWGVATEVAPWQAFRFRAKGPRRNGNPRNLTIPASVQAPPARTAERPVLRFALAATSETGRPLADRMLTVAFDGATAGFDMDEDVEKFQPPTTAYALIGARAGGEILGHDARPFGPAEIPLAIEARGAQAAMTLSWDASALPAGLPVVLVDLATGEEVDVRARSSYAFRAETRPALAEVPLDDLADPAAAADRFVLRIGAALATTGDVTAVVLEAPVPNPSAGGARLEFGIPEAGAVRLSVFDARGRKVAVLVDGSLAAGRHEARLPASLAAGVYVVRFEAGGAVVTRRAAVVR
ncbi:T9SS type A sorting domain-containing protein [Rubrivirga sp. IMCC45206]|uniref:T9SS type A sorting domain-containing protein n=1 Tax=Rubrivirga sp. IMCC45206 TaxID=3391614 RepID=UPI003990300A